MAVERKWPAAGPFFLVAPGTAKGELTILTTVGLHVKQKIQLRDQNPIPSGLALEIKRILAPKVSGTNSTMILEVGLPGTPISNRVDVSAFIAGSSFIFAPEQPRPDIPLQEVERAIYEEEPAVARRVISVDPLGQTYTENNPAPSALFGQQVSILNNLLAMQIQSQGVSPAVTPGTYLVNNEGFFVFDNEGNFIKAL